MTVNPFPIQQEIVTLLRTITNVLVYEGSVPDGTSIPMDANGKIKPHLVVNFAGLTEPPKKVNGITGAKDDSFLQGFSTHAIAGDDNAARQVHSLGWLKLIGFQPTACGEIRPAFFAGVGEISSLGQPTRFSAVQSYKFLINS
jgi:hypothetical protein